MSSQQKPNTIYCSACGHPNPSSRSTCEQCNTMLVTPKRRGFFGAGLEPGERPGCVTVFAVGLVALNFFSLLVSLTTPEIGLSIVTLVLSALAIVAAYGIWNMKQWGRLLIIIIQSVNIIYNALTIFTVGGLPSTFLFGWLLGAILSGITIYWFASNSQRFMN